MVPCLPWIQWIAWVYLASWMELYERLQRLKILALPLMWLCSCSASQVCQTLQGLGPVDMATMSIVLLDLELYPHSWSSAYHISISRTLNSCIALPRMGPPCRYWRSNFILLPSASYTPATLALVPPFVGPSSTGTWLVQGKILISRLPPTWQQRHIQLRQWAPDYS